MEMHGAAHGPRELSFRAGLAAAVSALCVSACTVGDVHGKADPPGGAGQGDSGAEGGQGNAGGAGGGGGASSEPCAEPGATRECSPAPCRRGTQTCQAGSKTASGETWGPCQDVKDVPGCTPPDAPCDCASPSPACEDYCKGRDGGTSCECPAGLTRWCHSGEALCRWGKQKCTPGGTWGPCEVVMDTPPGCEKYYRVYNRCCCVAAGACCEDDTDYYKRSPSYKDGAGPSVGACPAAACAPPAPPPAPVCPGSGFCVPGAQRYVVSDALGKTSWWKETCAAAGTWGAPMSVPAPPGCEKRPGDFACCLQSGACCRQGDLGCWYGKCDGVCWKS